MVVKEIDLEKIIPYVNNPRKNDDAVDYVAASLHEFGWQQPIVLDKDNVIIVGHTRYKAAKKLGMKKAPCVYADNLTPAQIKAYRIADNKVGEKAQWDLQMLNIELGEIADLDVNLDMSVFGVEALPDFDIDDYLADHEPKEKEPEEPEQIQCPHCGQWFTP